MSYSHRDARWRDRLRVHLRPLDRDGKIDYWDDTRLDPGQDWLKEIEKALAAAKVAILLVSADFLASDFIIGTEVPGLLSRAEQQGCRIVPLIVQPCRFLEIKTLQRFQAVNSPRRPLSAMKAAEVEEIFVRTAEAVDRYLEAARPSRRSRPVARIPAPRNARLEAILRTVRLGDWEAATQAALTIVANTRYDGANSLFDSLFDALRLSTEDDRLWGALQTIESCVRIAPWLIRRRQLARLAASRDFAVRSSAAVICMDLAHCAPERVPLDLVLKLSVHDEDWYVEVPASSALKAMARTFPDVLTVFYNRLRGEISEAQSHAAFQLRDIARKEPELLDAAQLRRELGTLRATRNADALKCLREALRLVQRSRHRPFYRYAL